MATNTVVVHMRGYYKVNSLKVGFGEYWNIVRSWKVIFPWCAKLFRQPMRLSSGLPAIDTLKEFQISEGDVEPEAMEKLRPLLELAQRHGFHDPRYYLYAGLKNDIRTTVVVLGHAAGETSLRLMHTISRMVIPPTRVTCIGLLSEFHDGAGLVSSNLKASFKGNPVIRVNRHVGASFERLWESHQRELDGARRRNPPRVFLTREAVEDLNDRYERASHDFHVQRGVYVLMSDEEVVKEKGLVQTRQEMQASGLEHADVLFEIRQLQQKQAGWGNAFWVFLVSIILFVTMRTRQSSWEFMGLLVIILFIHELGHYLTMRAFNYRNLKMFFIPFFGAAVTGQHHNVPGWKKVIVYLMGPVPGIILGAIAGTAGIMFDQPFLNRVAALALVINGINLLPVLPMDGGWICHILLFSRHYILDIIFRVLAVAALGIYGVTSHNRVLLFLALFTAMGLPMAYKIARLAYQLRMQGVPPAAPDDETMPTATGQLIVTEVKKVMPELRYPKLIAARALEIFETLNACPPRWPATFGLLAVQGSAIALSLMFAFGVVLGRGYQGGRANPRPLPHAFDCGQVLAAESPRWSEARNEPQNTVVASYGSAAAAARAFASITNVMPPVGAVRVFGESVLVRLPATDESGRKSIFDRLYSETKQVFVVTTNRQASMTISAEAPDESRARELERELESYLEVPVAAYLKPPWYPAGGEPDSRQAQFQLARETFHELRKAEATSLDSQDLQDFNRKIRRANQEGDLAEEKKLRLEMDAQNDARHKASIERFRQELGAKLDTTVIDLYVTLPVNSLLTNSAEKEILRRLGERMGQLPLVDGRPAPQDARFSVRTGYAIRAGRRVSVEFITCQQIADGAPALAEWLCANGCRNIKYELHGGFPVRDGLDE